jgi:chromosome segregation ATPase
MDDVVINTEIDKLIDILSQKKRVELDELSKQLGIDKKKVKKWLLVLEDEGYIKLEYKLTRIFAVWSLDLGSSALGLQHVSEEDVKEGAGQAIAEVEIPEEKKAHHERKKAYEPSWKAPAEAAARTDASLRKIQERMAECADEAKTVQNSIKELKSKKARLDAELPQLEAYGGEKAAGIEERMDALQKRMNSLKKNLRGAEELASNVNQRSKMAKALVDEASEVYIKLDGIFKGLKEEGKGRKDDFAKEIEEMEDETAQRQARLSALDDACALIDRTKEDAERRVEAIRERVKDANKQLEDGLAAVRAIEEKRDTMAARIMKTRKAIAERRASIEALKSEIEETGKLEAKLDTYIKNYSEETDDIRTLVTRAETEIRDIDEKASAKAMETYREELERTADRMERKTKEVSEGKAKIDYEISEKRARLKKIEAEAKELEKRLKRKK